MCHCAYPAGKYKLKQRRTSTLKRHSILLKRINVEIWRCFNVEIRTLFQRWKTTLLQRWNLTLFQRWNPTLFQCWNLTLFQTLKSDVEKTLKMGCFPDVEIYNVVSILKIDCLTSRPNVNLKTTLCAGWVINDLIVSRMIKVFQIGFPLCYPCHSQRLPTYIDILWLTWCVTPLITTHTLIGNNMHVLKIRYMTPVIHVTYRPNKFV